MFELPEFVWYQVGRTSESASHLDDGKGKKAQAAKVWVGLAVCRTFKRFYG
jgi:hypothetical protein